MSTGRAAGALTGRRVVVTQAEHQAGELCSLLASRGAQALPYPCIAIEPPPPAEEEALNAALRCAAAGDFHWLAVTSANAVAALARILADLALRPDRLAHMQIAAVGQATADAVRQELGLPVALIAQDQQAEGVAADLIAAWGGAGDGQRVLLPQGDLARPVLAQRLAAAGASVVTVVAYRVVPGRGGVDLASLLAAGWVDALTFTSSSTVRNCIERVRRESGDLGRLTALCTACLGPVTAQTARELGFQRIATAQTPRIAALVDALEQRYSEELSSEELSSEELSSEELSSKESMP